MDHLKNINPCKTGNWFGKPYYFFGDYLHNKYGCKVLKLPINAGFSCPNRDGTFSMRGCIFCSEEGSASPTALSSSDIREQMTHARNSFVRADTSTKYIAYFQAFTNTHAPVDILKKAYDTALESPDTIGLMIGTRPDCLSDRVLELIASYKKNNFELWLEIGMQTSINSSLRFLNRGHTHEDTRDAVKRASLLGIPLCLHIILGIPGESWHDMMRTAEEIALLPVQGIKFHHLHVIKGTPLHELYRTNTIHILSMKEYVSILCDFMERTAPNIIIHRLLGDRHEDTLVAPSWGMHKGTVIKAIEDEFLKRGTHQSFLYKGI